MQNIQTPEQQFRGDGLELDVHSIFYTIQGEGPFVGQPAVFIRLAGCNLQCPGCDTEYTKTRFTQSVIPILSQVHDLFGNSHYNSHYVENLSLGLVVITGGEPFRQNITKLAQELIHNGYRVQVETNGVLPPSIGFPREASIVCSPKAGQVNPELWERITAYKYVIEADFVDQIDGLPTSVLGRKLSPARPHNGYGRRIYVSPMDSGDTTKNLLNIQACVRSSMAYGYTLGLQLHKLVGLP